VDPEQQTVEFFRLDHSAYRIAAHAQGTGSLAHPDWDGLVLDLGALWL
jgi:hypothetical protein